LENESPVLHIREDMMAERPVLTVGLPLFRAKNIAWLGLESLCRQKDVNFSWELVVAEEKEPSMFGSKNIFEYEDRLERVGCERIFYIPVKRWIPLSRKWRLLADYVSKTSKTFIISSADEYSQPRRLVETHELLTKYGADWVDTPLGYAYNIANERMLLYDGRTADVEKNWQRIKARTGWEGQFTNLSMGTHTEYMRFLPNDRLMSGVDSWLAQSVTNYLGRPLYPMRNQSRGWKKALQVHGINVISTRNKFFEELQLPWKATNNRAEDSVPKVIANKLRKSKEFVISEKERINSGWLPG